MKEFCKKKEDLERVIKKESENFIDRKRSKYREENNVNTENQRIRKRE